MKKPKYFLGILVAVFTINFTKALAQDLKFTDGQFEKEITTLNRYNISSGEGLGVTAPITKEWYEYDKITIGVIKSYKGNSYNEREFTDFVNCSWYPKSKNFKSSVAPLKQVRVYIVEPDKNVDESIGEALLYSFYADRLDEFTFKMVIVGFDQTGTEDKYDNESKSWKKIPIYTVSKILYVSEEFSIWSDAFEKKRLEKLKEKYNDLATYIADNSANPDAWRIMEEKLIGLKGDVDTDARIDQLINELPKLKDRYNKISTDNSLGSELTTKYVLIRRQLLIDWEIKKLIAFEEHIINIARTKENKKSLQSKLKIESDLQGAYQTIMDTN